MLVVSEPPAQSYGRLPCVAVAVLAVAMEEGCIYMWLLWLWKNQHAIERMKDGAIH
jgi:hypothetical protein